MRTRSPSSGPSPRNRSSNPSNDFYNELPAQDTRWILLSARQEEPREGTRAINHTAPEGYTSVAPWVVTDDTGALLDFITAAFDGEELARVAVADGTIGHGEIRIGDTVVLAFDRRPGWPVVPSLLRVYVPDADAAMAAAVAHGARVVTEADDSAWGDRGDRVRDPLGNIWWVVSRGEQVAPDQVWQRMSEPTYAEAMRTARETLDAELSGREAGVASTPQRPTH